MKNRILTDALREVRRTRGRFLSLFLLSALAVAFLAGLRSTAPDMEAAADRYFDACQLMDLRVLSTLGLTGEDLAWLSHVDGVSYVEGAYSVDAIIHSAERELVVKVHSLTEGVNRPRLRSGRLPAGPGECAVEPALLDALGLALGDAIVLDTGDGDYADALDSAPRTIVGVVDSPLYISQERGTSTLGTGKAEAFLLLPPSAFDLDTYTEAWLLADGAARLLCYGDGYEALLDGLTGRVEALGEARAGLRKDQVLREAMGELTLAQETLERETADARRELDDAWDTLSDARTQLDEGWAEYEDGVADYDALMDEQRSTLDESQAALDDALAELRAGQAEYDAGMLQVTEGRAALDEAQTELDDARRILEAGQVTLDATKKQLEEGRAELVAREAEYAAGAAALADGWAELEAARVLARQGQAELDDAALTLSQGEAQYAAGLKELQAQEAQLSAAEAEAEALRGWLDKVLAPAAEDPAAALERITTPQLADQSYAALFGPLDQALEQVRPDLPAAQQGQADRLRAALPADGDALWAGLTGEQSAAYAAGLSQALVGGYALLDPVTDETLDALADARAQLETGKAQLAATRAQLDAGQAELAAGRAELAEAQALVSSGTAELEARQAELDAGRAELDAGWKEYNEGAAALAEAQAQADSALAELEAGQAQLDAQARTLGEALAELEASRPALEAGWADYYAGVAQLQQGRYALEEADHEARETFRTAREELEEGEADYQDGLQDYWDGEAEANDALTDARRELNDARREVLEIEDAQWYVLDRESGQGYLSFQMDAQRMGSIADLFPLIFFLVAALVCLTTMTRMVEEHRVEIGGMKALGYGTAAISVKYVGYGLSASLLGGLTGLAVGVPLFPTIIFTAWQSMYTIGPLALGFYPALSLLSVGAAAATVTLAAALTCRSTLAAVPAQLMRPRAPKAGKRVLLERVGPLWRRLSFLQKVTLRNLFRYKRRFCMTVAGIGGCTALIVTGFGLRDSLLAVSDIQYGELSRYTLQVVLSDNITQAEAQEVDAALSAAGAEALPARLTAVTASAGGREVEVYQMAAAGDQDFGDLLVLRDRTSHDPVPLTDGGVVITEKLSQLLSLSVGDPITLSGDGTVTATVTGITENYVYHYIYLTADGYAALYGSAPEGNARLVRCADDAADTVSAAVVPLAGVTAVTYIADSQQVYQQSMAVVDAAVLLVIVSAGALAFVVLLNLSSINLTERLRELATLKVLGFYDRELSAYVFRENILLTVFGVLAGLVMGKYLHRWLILTVEIDLMMFGRSAHPLSYLWAALLTVLFSFLTGLLSRRRLRDIDMVESLKTVE